MVVLRKMLHSVALELPRLLRGLTAASIRGV